MAQWQQNSSGFSNFRENDGLSFLGYSQLGYMALRTEYRKPCEIIAREATREWIRFNTVADNSAKPKYANRAERLKTIESEFRRLDIRSIIHRLAYDALIYGIGHVWIEGGETSKCDSAHASPLILHRNSLGPGFLRQFRNIEPIWTCAGLYNADNPLSENYFRPSHWWVQGVLVDASRLISLTPHPVADILKPSFNFGGLALTQLLKPYVHNFLATRDSVSTIVRNFSKLVLKTDLTANLQAGMGLGYNEIDPTGLEGRVALMQDISNGQGTIIVDREREDASIIATPLTGLDALLAQAMEAMASVPGIPLVKRFGLQPAGLNASSEGEIRVFYDEIAAFQEAHLRPALERILYLIQYNLRGEIDETISFEFVHLWQMDEKELSEIEKVRADIDTSLIHANVISPLQARERQVSETQSIYRNVNLTP